VRAARRVPGLPKDVVAVEIEHDRGRDLLVLCPDAGGCTVGEITLRARLGLVRYCDGQPAAMALVDGTALNAGKHSLHADAGPAALGVVSVDGRTVVLQQDVPDTWRPGQHILAGDTGYGIESVSGRQLTVRDYPVMPCAEVRLMPTAVWALEQAF
jgi:hypothetical protein